MWIFTRFYAWLWFSFAFCSDVRMVLFYLSLCWSVSLLLYLSLALNLALSSSYFLLNTQSHSSLFLFSLSLILFRSFASLLSHSRERSLPLQPKNELKTWNKFLRFFLKLIAFYFPSFNSRLYIQTETHSGLIHNLHPFDWLA